MILNSDLSAYRKCVADIDNFIQSHSEDFSFCKFLTKKDVKNLHRMFNAIIADIGTFFKYSDMCDLKEYKNGELKLLPL